MDKTVRSEQVNVISLVRGEEHFVFVFDPKRRTELLRLLGRYAADPSMSSSTRSTDGKKTDL